MSRNSRKIWPPVVAATIVAGLVIGGAWAFKRISLGLFEEPAKTSKACKGNDQSVSLVLTQKDLDSFSASYLNDYPNLTVVLHPSVDKSEFLNRFTVQRHSHKVIQVRSEESIFHVLKQLNSRINLVTMRNLEMSAKEVEGFHLDKFLTNIDEVDSINKYV
ncbi:hypothetical protein KL930_000270 [Ogataea haglerorum]|nr:hypothetical protein KL951_002249 [Ogataea haglerorum]KAG7701276.1 hypothetical protein KL915_000307 [Ogataea haglerorum]KAG7706495.1 hypothetical protein KL950_003160 [Ogataea haglerorum]KAG7741813.1 hypothetical protein KL923_001068 [Ogataea haglerorum]KAG7742351.1 hypothetical protein KL932_002493 [Ogataea haglerorum]